MAVSELLVLSEARLSGVEHTLGAELAELSWGLEPE